LRQDNARFRLVGHAEQLKIANSEYIAETKEFAVLIDNEIKRLNSEYFSEVSEAQLLRRPENGYIDLKSANNDLPASVIKQVEIDIKYAGYIEREKKRIEKVRLLEQQEIPVDTDYWKIDTISYESREKLSRIRPENIAQAARIPGISPADIAILAIATKS